ncbi:MULTISPECIES: hypothetical protein [unclassified Paraburkholderia]|uniref:hypothetical protein n=1 Tax=unclassified Paraburkholderia TaxID=2615204 RepID=UPI00160B2AF6|nr:MULTISPECIES: hypothetical protein [unclassified Paraburkholderia]MBB5442404.1 hypothetical protein [Paraburkholderia sp. WSM4177]MBB5482788.1 hypothetical protein [Paraburkholderia sp. WSM4180]
MSTPDADQAVGRLTALDEQAARLLVTARQRGKRRSALCNGAILVTDNAKRVQPYSQTYNRESAGTIVWGPKAADIQ